MEKKNCLTASLNRSIRQLAKKTHLNKKHHKDLIFSNSNMFPLGTPYLYSIHITHLPPQFPSALYSLHLSTKSGKVHPCAKHPSTTYQNIPFWLWYAFIVMLRAKGDYINSRRDAMEMLRHMSMPKGSHIWWKLHTGNLHSSDCSKKVTQIIIIIIRIITKKKYQVRCNKVVSSATSGFTHVHSDEVRRFESLHIAFWMRHIERRRA